MDKHLPASVRRKLQQEAKAKPCVFEALPLAGDLAPGERCNVRVRFSPTEEVRGAGVCHRMGSEVMRAQHKEQGTKAASTTVFCLPKIELSPKHHGLEPGSVSVCTWVFMCLETAPGMLQLLAEM